MSPKPAAPTPSRRWRFGRVEFDEGELALTVDGVPVTMERKPLEVLRCLLAQQGRLVTKDALIRAVWPGRIITDAALSKSVARLRDAIGDRDQNLVKTHHGYGYRLVAPMVVEGAGAVPTAPASADPMLAMPDRTARPLPTPNAEHRPLSVLFCELVDSTPLAEALDPEAYRELLTRYRQRAAGLCRRYEAHLARPLSDGLQIYFGYPVAHDDDAERALRCACELLTVLCEPFGTTPLSVRIGVHTGAIVIGPSDDEGEIYATGAGLHLAARLQSLAEPDSILTSDATFRLVPGLFITRDFGPLELRGMATPVRVHQVIQPSGVRSRLEGTGRLTPFVGREAEMRVLDECWREVVDGCGKSVLIRAEPGLGKSRLLLSARERLAGSAHTWLECRASALTRHSVYQPLVELLQRRLGTRAEESDEDRVIRLEQMLEALGIDLAATLPLLALLLNLPLPERYPRTQLGPDLRRMRTIDALTGWILRLAHRQPVVIAFEDLHWADESTSDALGVLMERIANVPILLLISARPEFQANWPRELASTRIELLPLTATEGEQMLDTLVPDLAWPAPLRGQVLDRAGGVPLFVEELARAVRESGSLERGAQGRPLAIPNSLRALLMARLDRLGPARELIQIAAVIGREVPLSLLGRVAALDPDRLRQDLETLADAGLLLPQAAGPEKSVAFKHALIQDAAYEVLLRARRQQLHALIAEALEAHFPERTRHEPEVLALHYEKAGRIQAALRSWSRAAERAVAAGAYSEAVRHGEHALQLLPQAHDPSSLDGTELQIQVDLATAKLALLGRGHPDLVPIMERCEALRVQVDDAALQARALVSIALTRAGIGDYPGYAAAGDQLIALGLAERNRGWEGAGHNLATQARHFMGEFRRSLHHIQQAELTFTQLGAEDAIGVMGLDGLAVALGFKAYLQWLLGYPDQACGTANQLLARAQATGHLQTLGMARSRAAWQALFRREPEVALDLAHAGIAHAERYGYGEWQGLAQMQVGIALGLRGAHAEAIERLRLYQPSPKMTRFLFGSLARGYEAQFCLAAGRHAEARCAIDAAFVLARQFNERHWLSELHRLDGELLELEHAEHTWIAESAFRQAVAVAQEQGALSLELRASTCLARHLWHRGRAREAKHLLQAVYQRFTEGFETGDLREARDLLESIDIRTSPAGVIDPCAAVRDIREAGE